MYRSIRPFRAALTAAITLPLLVIASNFTLLGHMPPTAQAAGLPTSCAAIATAQPTARDGTYLIFVGYLPVHVYCAMMSTAPATYLTLPHSGNSSNYAVRHVGFSQTVETWFTKVRFLAQGQSSPNGGATCQAQACIYTSDFAYSHSQGSSQFGNQESYAVAAGCVGPAGTANVDLRGTVLRVLSGSFTTAGYNPWGSAAYSANNQVVNLVGNGGCGDEEPVDSPLLSLESTLGRIN